MSYDKTHEFLNGEVVFDFSQVNVTQAVAMNILLKFVSVAALLCFADGFKVLVVFPVPAKSHGILGNGYVRHLLNAGHEVTLVTPYPGEKPHKNLTFVDVSENLKALPAEILDLKNVLDGKGAVNDVNFAFNFFPYLASLTVKNENVQKLLNDPSQTFDVVIAEWMFSELYSGFGAVFDCPFIWSSPIDPHWMVLKLIDQPNSPALYPDMQSSNLPPFSFKQRVEELWCQIVTNLKRHFTSDVYEVNNYQNAIAPAIAKRGKPVPSLDELKYNASMLIANSHISFGQSISLPANCKTVGGYHIEEDVKALPEDLQKIMDGAKNGVIYFSMGSNLPSSKLPEVLKKGILKMFGKLKQTVLWKFEEVLPDLPENVRILKWAPQESILAHPNCVLFITHGGLLSTTETIHFGVPTIGIPVFGDQFNNVARAVDLGYAKKVDLSYDMVDNLYEAIVEVLGNPKYTEKVKQLSQIYHDRPVKPGKELVHWVEHVVRTGGAPHLRSPALMLPWYQKMYLDLAAVIVLTLIALKVIVRKLFKLIWTVETKKKSD